MNTMTLAAEFADEIMMLHRGEVMDKSIIELIAQTYFVRLENNAFRSHMDSMDRALRNMDASEIGGEPLMRRYGR